MQIAGTVNQPLCDRRTFHLDSLYHYETAFWLIISIFALLILVNLGVPIEDHSAPSFSAYLLFATLWFLFGGTLIRCLYRHATYRFLDISVDDKGLWPSHLAAENARVSWSEIQSVQPRRLVQQFDLLDASGRRLLKVNYALQPFDELRHLLLTRTTAPPLSLPKTFSIFTKRWWFDIRQLLGLIIYVVFSIGYYIESGRSVTLLFIAVMTVGMFTTYLVKVTKLIITPDQIEISYLLRRRIIKRNTIDSIRLVDKKQAGFRHFEVAIDQQDVKKPIIVDSLGSDTIDLYRFLVQWLNDHDKR
ncbi:hypothetical protein HED60_22865 [Planctomycetales bacterium ZRK34]|nr:hypothetical protein HED60_22865 [Planctomycetales bacterium ZRK34]